MKKMTLLMALLFFCSWQIIYAQVNITGKVTDSKDGMPLPGVNIQVKGTNVGTITDFDGNYIISASSGQVLEIKFIGYLTQEVTIGSETTYDVLLEVSEEELGEVVVTALGMTRNQKALSYDVDFVSSKDITNVAATNFGSALYGKTSGVRIITSPGGSTSAVSINIRGFNSLSFSNQPLIVLDGIPFRNDDVQTGRLWGGERIEGNGLLDINPEDIENISVLKGAAASSLYGSEANNGVIVITTKKGTTEKPGLGINFSMSHTIDQLAFAPKLQNTYGPGYPASWGVPVNDNGYYEYTLADGSTVATPYWRAYTNFGPRFNNEQVMWWDGEMRPYSAQPDNYKDVFRTGSSSMYNLSVSNGGSMGNFRLSYTYQDNKPIQYGSWNNKHSLSFNSTLKISKVISTDFVVNYLKSRVHNRPKTMNFINGYSFNRAEDPGMAMEYYQKPDGYKYTQTSTEDPENYLPLSTRSRDLMDYYWDMLHNNYDEYVDRLMANVTLNFTFTEWLKLRTRIGTDYTLQVNEEKVGYEKPKILNANQGNYNVLNYNYRTWYSDVILTATQKFGDFDFDVNIGATMNSVDNRFQVNKTRVGLDLEGWYSLNNSIRSDYEVESTSQRKLKNGIFGLFNIGYKSFAYIDASIRQEQVSTLPPDNNNFIYPSFGGTLIYTEMMNIPAWWNFGKLRASYGITGKEPNIYAANNAYNSTTINGVTINSYSGDYGNDKIRPERKTEFEIGIENKMFNHRLGIEITYYNNRIKDNILWLDVPTSSGISKMLSNAAEIKNTGLEFSVNVIPIQNALITWNSRLNFSFNENEVVKLADGIERLELSNEGGYNAIEVFAYPGRPFGDIYSLHILQDENGNNMVDADGFYIRDQEYSYRGNVAPKVTGGFGNTVTYKNFSLDFLIDFRFGGQMFSFTNYYGMGCGRLEESLQYRDAEHGGLSYYEDAGGNYIATNAGSGPNGEVVMHDGVILQGVDPDGNPNNQIIKAEDYYGNLFDWGSTGLYGNAVYDNSYIKFREISLGYVFDQSLVKRIGFQSLSVSLIGRNLFYIWKTIPNIDPEASNGTGAARTAFEITASQPIRSFGFMLRASF